MKKNITIKGFLALILITVLYSIQCLFMCGAVKLLTMILNMEFDLLLTIMTFLVCKIFQIIGYFAGFRWE